VACFHSTLLQNFLWNHFDEKGNPCRNNAEIVNMPYDRDEIRNEVIELKTYPIMRMAAALAYHGVFRYFEAR